MILLEICIFKSVSGPLILKCLFSGKPPTMKGGELAKRAEKREAAAQELKAAEEKGDQENIDKFTKRFYEVYYAYPVDYTFVSMPLWANSMSVVSMIIV